MAPSHVHYTLWQLKFIGDIQLPTFTADDDPSNENGAPSSEEIDACDDPSTEIVGTSNELDVPSEETELDYQHLGCSSSNQNGVFFKPLPFQ